jgi:hypothetical protein
MADFIVSGFYIYLQCGGGAVGRAGWWGCSQLGLPAGGDCGQGDTTGSRSGKLTLSIPALPGIEISSS